MVMPLVVVFTLLPLAAHISIIRAFVNVDVLGGSRDTGSPWPSPPIATQFPRPQGASTRTQVDVATIAARLVGAGAGGQRSSRGRRQT